MSQLDLSPVTVNFTFTVGGAAPAPQPVVLTGTPTDIDGLVIGTILYAPISSGWLSADFGASGPNTPTTVVLTAAPPADLAPGSYVATVPVGSTVTGVTTQYVVATLTVIGSPIIDLSPQTVSLSVTQGGANPSPQFVDVENIGTGTLSGLSVGTIAYGGGATGWLSAALDASTAPATLTLQVNQAGLATGTYTAQVPVRSSLSGVAPDTVLVSLGVSAVATPPTIAVSPGNVPIAAVVGGSNPAAQLASVTNAGGGTLGGLLVGTITYGAGARSWLTATLNQATAPAQITLQATTGSLAAGTYTATVPVQSTQAGVASKTFTVTFTVSAAPPAPVINLAPSTAAFTATAGAGNPPSTTVTITNGGGGTLSQLALGTTSYGAGATGWLSATLGNTTAPATITLNATTGALAPGSYTATVPVSSGLAGVTPVDLTVTFTVISSTAAPAIGLAPQDANFAAAVGGANPSSKAVQVTNAGGGALTGLAIGTISYTGGGATGWLSASINSNTAPATVTVQAATGALAAGTYRALIPVTSSVAGVATKNIGVRFDVSGVPTMSVSPSSLTFTGTTGQPSPTPGTVAVSNSGGGTIGGLSVGTVTYGAGQPTGWLATSLSSTTTPSTLVLTPTTGALAAGTYTATVPVNSTTAGVTGKTVSVSFLVGAPSGGLVILQGDGQTGLVGSTLPVQLKARVLDQAGLPSPGVAVVWQVNNGGSLANVVSTSNSNGEVLATWTLGPLAGIHTTTVSGAGLPTITFQADVQLPSNPGGHPNEPAGYVAFAEHNMSSLPTYPRSLGGLLGSWFNVPTYTNLSVVTPDLTAPESPPNVMETRYPAGFKSGTGPANWGGWDAAGNIQGQKSKFYFSMWLKFQGADFEMTPAGLKLGFIGFGRNPSSGGNEGVFVMESGGCQAVCIKTGFPVKFHQQGHIGSRDLFPNVAPYNSGSNIIKTNVWQHWEAVFELNTLGQADGILKWWIDGALIMSYSNVEYITTGNTNGFNGWTWNPTWNGVSYVKTRADYLRQDHVYMSGQ